MSSETNDDAIVRGTRNDIGIDTGVHPIHNSNNDNDDIDQVSTNSSLAPPDADQILSNDIGIDTVAHPIHDSNNDNDDIDQVSTNSSLAPPDADQILSEEMMKLSMKERTNFQEEIHGVRCLAPEESPLFLRESLRKLDLKLNDPITPIDQRKGYLKSQELFVTRNLPTYVNTDKFRLRFLRCETFDVEIAAQRIFKYLNVVLELFGNVALQRPIRMTDFSKEELRIFRKGRYQFLPYRDRSAGTHGRRILAVFPDEEWEAATSALRTKIWLYMTYVAGEDLEAQKTGIVVLVWFDSSWKNISKNPYVNTDSRRFVTLGTRASSVHLCTPDSHLYRRRRSAIVMRAGKEKSRVKIHVGHSMEIRYILQGFGIPIDYIPISFTGTVKEKYVKEWIRLRVLIEEKQDQTGIYDPINSIIESPYLQDIIFRNGTSLTSHPANATLRSLVVAKCNEKGYANKKATELVVDIVDELKQQQNASRRQHEVAIGRSDSGWSGCRFLIWNEKECYWKPVEPENEEKEIHKKITRMVRETRSVMSKNDEEKGEETMSSSSKRASKSMMLQEQQVDPSFLFVEGQGELPKKRQRVCFPEMAFKKCGDD